MSHQLQDAIERYENYDLEIGDGAIIVRTARKVLDIEQIINDNWLACEVGYHLDVDGVKQALGVTEDTQ